jgi:DNA-directed RNA polymerase sigma subunit (sigma70/sigma32)
MTPEVGAMLAFMSQTAEERLDWLLAAGLDAQELRALGLLGCIDGRPALTERRAARRLGVTTYRLRKIKQAGLMKVRAQWRREGDEKAPDARV